MAQIPARPIPPRRCAATPSILILLRLLPALLAAATPGLAQLPVASAIEPGTVSFALASGLDSSLGLELGDLEAFLCGRRGGLGECGLPVNKEGVLDPLTLNVTQVLTHGFDGGASVAQIPQSFRLTGPPLETVCGTWTYHVTLDPQAIQSSSWLDLAAPLAAGDPTAAFSAASLRLAARVTFTSGASEIQAKGIELPLTLDLSLQGRWTVILSTSAPALARRATLEPVLEPVPAQQESNLALLVERNQGIWTPAPVIATDPNTGTRCGHWLALQSTAAVAGRLNGQAVAGRNGMSWGKIAHTAANGVDHVGCLGCNAYTGDTACSSALPLLCIRPDGAPVPPGVPVDFNDGWIGGNLGLTAPVRGDQLSSLSNAHALCQAAFGPGYQMAEFHHPSGGWSWSSRGNVDAATRFWVSIGDQPANCWNP